MGRPVNKRFFGVDTNNNLKVQFHNGTASVPGHIVKQKGSKKFVCSDASGNQATCFLVDKASAALVVGEMTVTVKLDDTTVDQVTKISGRTITVGGEKYPWNFSTSTSDGAAQVEEAGTSVSAIAVTAAAAGVNYIIVTAGNTDFTAIGAADSNVGTTFTASGAGTGTGTVRDIGDDFEGDE